MPNSYFRFKQFIVDQSLCAMKVGTDGVLLGAWTNVEDTHRILDIGSGSGLVSLMLAQRSSAHIVAIDIDEGATRQSKLNFEASPWTERLQAIHVSLQNFINEANIPFDLIVCNPPYFSKSLKAPSAQRSLARHDDTLPLEHLFEQGVRLLSRYGRLSLVLPFDATENAMSLAVKSAFSCMRRTDVISVEGKKPKRVLLEFGLRSDSYMTHNEIVIQTKDNCYTDSFLTLTSAFYLDSYVEKKYNLRMDSIISK